MNSVLPAVCLDQYISGPSFNESLSPILHSFDRILVVGGGKAGVGMTVELERQLELQGIDLNRVHGWVNVPRESVVGTQSIKLHPARPGGTNQPTEAAANGAERILELASNAGPDDLMIVLLSGGGSALLPAPVEGVSLSDKQAITQLLHQCGATINEMNTVRKHLSRIKGGNLARAFCGRQVLSLIISDVLGDPLDIIASGPTVGDPSTAGDALSILETYELVDAAPTSIEAHLKRVELEGRKPPQNFPCSIHNEVIANIEIAMRAAQDTARELGYGASLLPLESGDTETAARNLANKVQTQPGCYIAGGETTVQLPMNHGLGGRNQHYVLSLLNELKEDIPDELVVLSGGTDGEDGPTDIAGAFGDAQVIRDAGEQGLDMAQFLARHDAYRFFEKLGAHLKTGLTGTNVMDLRVILSTKNTEP